MATGGVRRTPVREDGDGEELKTGTPGSIYKLRLVPELHMHESLKQY